MPISFKVSFIATTVGSLCLIILLSCNCCATGYSMRANTKNCYPARFHQPSSMSIRRMSQQQQQSVQILEKPKWASGGVVSDIVNALISFKPLFGVMKFAARKVLSLIL